MLIQSSRVWVCGEFIPAQLDIENGKIKQILPLNTRTPDFD